MLKNAHMAMRGMETLLREAEEDGDEEQQKLLQSELERLRDQKNSLEQKHGSQTDQEEEKEEEEEEAVVECHASRESLELQSLPAEVLLNSVCFGVQHTLT